MAIRKTYFEQVPLAVVRKISIETVTKKNASASGSSATGKHSSSSANRCRQVNKRAD
ncbi:MAG TPA: hypothetical protein VGZ91_00470 [Candidatus Sulfotelmatobacter sp.]|jgi:hypothetical protein|nr:hypothetical protein [Candidatus Sulfotelmatobacter sp.]